MRTVYIDFTDSGIDRTQFRRMVKTFQKVKMFSHAEEKILYFKIAKDAVADAFILSCYKELQKDGFICKIIQSKLGN